MSAAATSRPRCRAQARSLALALLVIACAASRVRADDVSDTPYGDAPDAPYGDVPEPRDVAEEEEPRRHPYVWLGYGLAEGEAISTSLGAEHAEDAAISERFEGGYAHPVLPYLSVGALVQRVRWRSELDAAAARDGSVLHALSLAAELRAFPPSQAVFYARVAVGAVLDDLATSSGVGFREQSDLALGLHLSLRGGVQVIMFEHFGIGVELALERYFFEHTVEVSSARGDAFDSVDDVGYELHATTAQVAIVVPL